MDVSTAQTLFVNDVHKVLPSGCNVSIQGRCTGHTIATVTQELWLPAKKTVSLFKCLQQRTINGRPSGKAVDCLLFFENLVERQLLLPMELEILSRAVVQGECLIEPALCRSSHGIDALRMMSAFLVVLHKSPQIKKAIERFIEQAPVLSGSQFFTGKEYEWKADGACPYDRYSVTNIKQLQSKLISVLKKYNSFIELKRVLPMLCDQEIRQYLRDLLKPLIHEMAFFQCTAKLLSYLNDSKHYELLRTELTHLIDNLKNGIQSINTFDGRVDRMTITKVLILNQTFSYYITLLACARRLCEGVAPIEHQPLEDLLDHPFFLDRKYIDILQCRNIDFNGVGDKDPLLNNSLQNEIGCLWVYFSGVHFEFDLTYPWGKHSDFNRAVSFEEDGVPCPLIKDVCFRKWLRYTGLSSYKWLVGLYLELHKWLEESSPVVDKVDATAFRERIWDCDYNMLDDFHWLISVIARSGLRPYRMVDCSKSISLLCPNCSYDAELKRESLFKGVHYIHQLRSQFLALLQDHKKIQECTVAQSIEPARLRSERHQQI